MLTLSYAIIQCSLTRIALCNLKYRRHNADLLYSLHLHVVL